MVSQDFAGQVDKFLKIKTTPFYAQEHYTTNAVLDIIYVQKAIQPLSMQWVGCIGNFKRFTLVYSKKINKLYTKHKKY